jgi:hypothetical protein
MYLVALLTIKIKLTLASYSLEVQRYLKYDHQSEYTFRNITVTRYNTSEPHGLNTRLW